MDKDCITLWLWSSHYNTVIIMASANTTPNVEEDRISAHEECFSCEAIASPQKWGKETDLKPWYTFDRRLECQNVHVKPNKTLVKQRPPNRWINMLMKILIPFFYNNYKCVCSFLHCSISSRFLWCGYCGAGCSDEPNDDAKPILRSWINGLRSFPHISR